MEGLDSGAGRAWGVDCRGVDSQLGCRVEPGLGCWGVDSGLGCCTVELGLGWGVDPGLGWGVDLGLGCCGVDSELACCGVDSELARCEVEPWRLDSGFFFLPFLMVGSLHLNVDLHRAA